MTVVDDRLARWRAGFDEMFGLVAGEFAQVESRRRARLYVLGLLSGAERKNYRHITLSMLAAVFLAITAYRERSRDEKGARILLAST